MKNDNGWILVALLAGCVILTTPIYLVVEAKSGKPLLAVVVTAAVAIVLCFAVSQIWNQLDTFKGKKRSVAGNIPDEAVIPTPLPKLLDDKLARLFFDGFVAANILDADYQPNGEHSNAQLTYMVSTVADILNQNYVWAEFEKFWDVRNLRQSHGQRKVAYKFSKDARCINDVTLQVGQQSPIISKLAHFIKWRKDVCGEDL